MKSSISIAIITLVTSVAFPVPVNAQQNVKNDADVAFVSNKLMRVDQAENSNTENPDVTALPAVLNESYFKLYPDAKNVKWFKIKGGTRLVSLVDGKKTTTVLQDNGKLNYSIMNVEKN